MEKKATKVYVKATLATPDQLWTEGWKLNEHEAPTVFADPSKLRIWGGDRSILWIIIHRRNP